MIGGTRRLASVTQVQGRCCFCFSTEPSACSCMAMHTVIPALLRNMLANTPRVLQLLAQGGWWRGLSSRAAPAELPSLKAALRAVYKKVHPDLFHDCQSARVRGQAGVLVVGWGRLWGWAVHSAQ